MSRLRYRNWTQLDDYQRSVINDIISKAEELETMIDEKIYNVNNNNHEAVQALLKLQECVHFAVHAVAK